MIWTTYLDETDTHNAPVMALGGFLSTADRWSEFDKAWQELLRSHNLDYSHAVDLNNRKKQFRGWDDAQHNDFVGGAREIMNKHIYAGFVGLLRRNDYEEQYKSLAKPRRIPEDTMYGVLMRACVSFSLALVSFQSKAGEDEVINFVIENGGVKPNYAMQLYERFKNDPLTDADLKKMLAPAISFVGKKECSGCQVTDLMLSGAIRQERLEHSSEASTIEHSSLADIMQPIDQVDVPTFRIPVGGEVLRSLRNNMFVEEKIRKDWAKEQLQSNKLLS